MTDSARPAGHPSPDELADLREGILTGDAEQTASSHVAACADCTAELAALDEVAALLADEGSSPTTMPADLAEQLDAAIARASKERAAGVTSLDERRASVATRTFRWLGAAAAVVIVGAGAATVLNGDWNASSSDSAGGDTADQAVDGENPEVSLGDSPKGDGAAARLAPQRVNKQTLDRFADAVDSQAVSPHSTLATSPAESYAFNQRCEVPASNPPVTALAVRWGHRPAYVIVDTEARVATVYGCDTPPERLYSTSY